MKRLIIALAALLTVQFMAAQQTLRDAIGRYCLVGSSLNITQSDGLSPQTDAIIDRHFNTAVAENCMKGEILQPKEGKFDFREADRFVSYCEQHHLKAIGHVLVWHSQAPKWLYQDGANQKLTREVLIERLRQHIYTVVGRYKGRIYGWDVVNEAIEDDGSFRKSPLYNIIGEDFIELAFRFAHEADPHAELYYNDFSMAKPGKRETVCRIVRQLKEKGLRIDAIGMQSHNGMDYPDMAEYEKSIEAFAACGVKVSITELDMSVLPNPWSFSGADVNQSFEYQEKMNPYKNGLPADKAREIEARYLEFFKIYYKHRDKIARINLWGVSDADSWLNDFPIKGRTNYPLLFDRDYKEKPIIQKIIKLYSK